MAHGYAKAAGRPMGVMVHGTVGLQHASMAIYNAWVDRVPMIVFGGNGMRADTRRPGVEWNHCAQDPAVLLRDFIKWDDQPASLQQSSFMRQTLLRDADVILLLEVADPWGTLNSFADPYKTYRSIVKPDAKVIAVSMREVYLKSNYQDLQRYLPIDLAIGGDVEPRCPTSSRR
jgi:thiamine pyrophosphate-dependent acetolactate synthase large subunit-like protein